MTHIDERNMFYGANPDTFAKAKQLRKSMTEAEKVLWKILKDKKTIEVKFRRQHPIGTFIVDFYCHKHKLVIEVDGEIHLKKENKEYDYGRTYELERLGLRVIRFSNDEILKNIEKVKNEILDSINTM